MTLYPKANTWAGGTGTGDEIPGIIPSIAKSPRAPKKERVKAGPQRLHGVVRSFDADKRFGFIQRKGGRDVFFHISAAGDSDTAYFFPGERVVFELGEDKRGRVCATYVRLAR